MRKRQILINASKVYTVERLWTAQCLYIPFRSYIVRGLERFGTMLTVADGSTPTVQDSISKIRYDFIHFWSHCTVVVYLSIDLLSVVVYLFRHRKAIK